MKILVVDDHALFREGVKMMLARLDPAVVLVEAGSVEGALSLAAGHDDFDLILLDLKLPGMRGEEGVRILRQRFPTSPIAVLSSVESAGVIGACMDNGAQAFIPKTASSETMIDILRKVLDGQSHCLNPAGGGDAGLPPRSPWKLTLRQIDVMNLVSHGMTNKEIARKLGISENTVRAHLAAIFQEMGVNSRTEVAAIVCRLGIV